MTAHTTSPIKVAIIQDYVPEYRRQFFDLVYHRAQLLGIDIVLGVGAPSNSLLDRGDSIDIPYSVRLSQRTLRIFGRRIVFRDLRPVIRGCSLVIVEQARRNLDIYPMFLLRRSRAGRRWALWGHGRDFAHRSNLIERLLLDNITRSADWFFAYTQRGADHVSSLGSLDRHITVVNNSIDSRTLADCSDGISAEDLSAFRTQLNLENKTAIFIGGLDESKRLTFLLEAAALVHDSDPDFRLLICGDGADRDLITSFANTHEWCHYLGRVVGTDKAIAMRAAELIMNPGRVGLLAVDSFAAGIPIVTTDWPYHAPEYDYLEHGSDAFVTADDPKAYAAMIVELLEDRCRLEKAQRACRMKREQFSVEKMAENFLRGVRECIAAAHA